MHSLQDEHLGVVIVDDDPIFRKLISARISQESNFTLFQAGSAEELFELLAKERIDCLILDYDLGNDSGLAVKQRVEESDGQHPPTIMMTGDGRESTAIRAFRMGVWDYLPKKDLRPEAVVASVLAAVERHRKESLVKAEHGRLAAASAVDFVTGVEGRSRLDERLTHLAELAPGIRAAYALIVVELEGYRNIAEAVGLKGADQALRAFGQKLQKLMRANDVCGRYGGGAFLVIADVNADAAALELICRRLSAELAQEIRIGAARILLSARVDGGLCANGAIVKTAGGSDVLASILLSLPRASEAPSPPEERSEAPMLPEPAIAAPLVPANASVTIPAADVLRTSERRREVRQRVFKRGLLHVIGAGGTFNCVVRNLSPRGAGLRLDAAFALPEICDLEIAGSGKRQRVVVRWQAGVDLGVEFVNKA